MIHAKETDCALDPRQYVLWTPPPGRVVETGADRHPVALPPLPLPLHREDLAAEPAGDAIGRGLYDYLRQFPDCPHNSGYAELLREAFPHYIADLGAQIVMLDHKEVDAPYIRRKLTSLKILALLEPENPGLLQQVGMVHLELGLLFSQLKNCRPHLLEAMGALQHSLRAQPDNPSCLNQLGQIDFLFGDYPSAVRRWQAVVELLAEGPARRALSDKIVQIAGQDIPDHPLVDDLEAIGEALDLYGDGDLQSALSLLERLEEEGRVPNEFPSPEFYYLLGMCRGRRGDPAGSFAAFECALSLDPEYAPAIEAKCRLVDEGSP